MARILYVEDDRTWSELVVDRLRDHHVDVASSLKDAVNLLQSEQDYQVALVDLNLETDSDRQGGEILDLVRIRHPNMRRIVVTGSPPAGPVQRNVIERYDVQEILIKRDMDIPELRRVVEEAISDELSILPSSIRFQRSLLKQRFRAWEREQGALLRALVENAEEHLEDTRRVSPQTRERAQQTVDAAKFREVEFRAKCQGLRDALIAIRTKKDLEHAFEALDNAQDVYRDEFTE